MLVSPLTSPLSQTPSGSLSITIPAKPSVQLTDAELLATCSMDITALERAAGLVEVITQVKSGEVQRIREKYGPQKGRDTFSKWKSMKTTITRRERVFGVLQNDFNNDEARFFAFFQITPPDGYQSIRKIAGAIPRMRTQVDEEMALVQYKDPESGEFSDILWQEKWEGQNGFEVWRAMGKESYDRL